MTNTNFDLFTFPMKRYRLSKTLILLLVVLMNIGCVADHPANSVITTTAIPTINNRLIPSETPQLSNPDSTTQEEAMVYRQGQGMMYLPNHLPIDEPFTYSTVDYDNTDAFFDLDTGTIQNNPKSDLYFSMSCGSECFFSISSLHESKAFFDIDNNIKPGFWECRNYVDGKFANPQNFISMRSNKLTCVITNQGRLGQIKVDGLGLTDNDEYNWVQFSYTLWDYFYW